MTFSNSSQTGSSHKRDFVTQCPGCGSFVKLPTVVATDAKVRCPKCSVVFALSSILPDTLPQLSIVEDNFSSADLSGGNRDAGEFDPNSDLSIDGKLVVSPILQKGAKRKRHHSKRQPSSDQGIGDNESKQATTTEFGRRSVATRMPMVSASRGDHRSKRKQASRGNSSITEALKIVFGALLALPVAQLIIWWGFGLDPLVIGPSVSQFAPVIVPAALHRSDAGQEDPDATFSPQD
jgi:hypothetical protein